MIQETKGDIILVYLIFHNKSLRVVNNLPILPLPSKKGLNDMWYNLSLNWNLFPSGYLYKFRSFHKTCDTLAFIAVLFELFLRYSQFPYALVLKHTLTQFCPRCLWY
jgi:hypothetical protein